MPKQYYRHGAVFITALQVFNSRAYIARQLNQYIGAASIFIAAVKSEYYPTIVDKEFYLGQMTSTRTVHAVYHQNYPICVSFTVDIPIKSV